jgi:hypothetical protein
MTSTDDRLDIMAVLARYARGIDRCHLPTLEGVWAAGAVADFGSGETDARVWSQSTVAALGAMLRTQHLLGQMLIEVDGDTASAETYCHAYHEVAGPDGPIEIVVGGRYLDRLVRTTAGWRIAHRRYVMDWNRNLPSTAAWAGPLYDQLQRVGARAPDDALFTGS